jgi:allantoicase
MNDKPMPAHWIDLASARVGGRALVTNDEFFAGKENLLREADAVFDPHAYTDRGKLMDGWESRRRREDGHDWCVVRLGIPGLVRRVVVDTAFFRGNFPAQCSVDACFVDEVPSLSWLANEAPWQNMVQRTDLQGDCKNAVEVSSSHRVSHLRLNIFPDGGVARLRVHGEAAPDWKELASRGQVDLAALENGGVALSCSDMFFSDRNNLLRPGLSTHMGDGWETKRRRGPGHDWVVVKLGHPGVIERVVVDTSHFKGNAPASCDLDFATDPSASVDDLGRREELWTPLSARRPLIPDNVHEFRVDSRAQAATHVRLRIHPDGGVARLRVFGRVASA